MTMQRTATKSTNHQQTKLPFSIVKLNDSGLYSYNPSTKIINKKNKHWGEWTITSVIDDDMIEVKNRFQSGRILYLSEAENWEVV